MTSITYNFPSSTDNFNVTVLEPLDYAVNFGYWFQSNTLSATGLIYTLKITSTLENNGTIYTALIATITFNLIYNPDFNVYYYYTYDDANTETPTRSGTYFLGNYSKSDIYKPINVLLVGIGDKVVSKYYKTYDISGTVLIA